MQSEHICICNNCKIGTSESNPTGHGKETTFRLINKSKKKVDIFIVDECLLAKYNRDEKCDYLFKLNQDKVAYLVECKGSDVIKAISQITSSLNLLKSNLDGNIIKGRVVATKTYTPDIRSRDYVNLREILKGNPIIRNKIIEKKI